MSFLEVENTKYIFFECYKIIENIQSVGSWYCMCHEYLGCQEIKNFIKNERRYCCMCQFQDTFNLWELNEVKRQIKQIFQRYMKQKKLAIVRITFGKETCVTC